MLKLLHKGRYDSERNLGLVAKSIGKSKRVIARYGNSFSELVFCRLSVFGKGYGYSLVCRCGYGVGKSIVVYVDCKVNKLVHYKANLGLVVRKVGNNHRVVSAFGYNRSRNVLAQALAVLEQFGG